MYRLDDLAAVARTKKSGLLLNEWPRTIEKTMATTKKFVKFSRLTFLFSLQLDPHKQYTIQH